MNALELAEAIELQTKINVELNERIIELQKQFDDEVQGYLNEINTFRHRVKYFASKRNMWMKKYNDKCQELAKLKK